METLPLDDVPALLVADAKGTYGTEAAVQVLVDHGRWLRRSAFLAACVNYDHHLDGPPVAWVDWAAVPEFVDRAPCSSSEARMLRLAAELAGVESGYPLDDLLASLDDRNGAIVLDAIAHVVLRGGAR